MQFRSLILLGFGASLLVTGSVFAAPPVPVPVASEALEVVQVAAKEEPQRKKRQAADSKAKSKTAARPLTEQEKRAAKARADKEKAEKARLAQIAKAKAEKEKKAAAAKAERSKKVAAARAEREKKAAAAKVAREKLMAERAKAAEQRKVARAKAAEERKLARAKAAEERRLVADARARAVQEQRLARARADQARQEQAAAASRAARQAEISQLASMDVVQRGNNGELRSETTMQAAPRQSGLLAGLFGGQQIQQQAMLPETRALDAAMEQRAARKQFNVRPEFVPTVVPFSGYPRGTIVVDTASHYLYLVESSGTARRYAIAVGKDGLKYKGTVRVGDKQEWPRWIPTKEMQAREPAKYARYAGGMPGGGQNPLGARAIYLHENGRDTYLRIHGTTAPETIGTDSSNGCFRMINEHVIDLYRRVPVGTQVVVL